MPEILLFFTVNSLNDYILLKITQNSSWNKTLIVLFDLGWHWGTRFSRDAGNVWTEGEFYHPLPGIRFTLLFMVKNRNVIVHVRLPKRNKQMRFILSEGIPSSGKCVFIHTLKERHNSCSHWGIFLSYTVTAQPWAHKTGQAHVVAASWFIQTCS